jgi:hypothetical protein
MYKCEEKNISISGEAIVNVSIHNNSNKSNRVSKKTTKCQKEKILIPGEAIVNVSIHNNTNRNNTVSTKQQT